MVIVHPGSLCGPYASSSSFDPKNLAALLAEIQNWTGSFAVIHNELSDELESDEDVGPVIADVIWQDTTRDYEAEGDLNDLKRAAREIFQDFDLRGSSVFVTGAWGGSDGCATSVAEELRRLGARPKLSRYVPVF